MKILIILIVAILFSIPINAQIPDLTLDSGVKPHKEIDTIYTTFTKGYRELNVDLVTNLYTEDANYLAPGNEMTDGKAKIRESFASFFDYVKNNGETMEIKFQILKREVDKRLGFDIGIYTINTFKDGKQIRTGQGKFLVVTKKIGNKWYFRFDGYSDVPKPKSN